MDKKGNFFVVNLNQNHGNPSIVEFAHGGTTPNETLSDPQPEPYACAIDPTTGNLAVSNESGAVGIYTKAQGSPNLIADGFMALMLWCGYDKNGDLFVDGLNNQITSEFDELPKGQTAFKQIALNQGVGFPGNIQWDGTYLTLADVVYRGNNASAIYQLKVSGSAGTIVGTTVLGTSEEVFGSWI